MPRSKRVGFAVVLGVLSCSTGWSAERAEPPADDLRGPAVRESIGHVRFSLTGAARLVERPELMALREATLSDQDRAAATKEIARRERLLTSFVADEIDALLRIQLAQSAGDTTGVVVEVFAGLGRLHSRGITRSLALDIGGVLTDSGRVEFERVLTSVWKRIASERREGVVSKVTRLDVLATQLKYGGEAFGKDLEEAFERAQRGGELAFAFIFRGVGLSESQRQRIRDKVLDFYAVHGPEPEKEVQDRFFLGVLGYLTEAQREKVLRKFGVVKDEGTPL